MESLLELGVSPDVYYHETALYRAVAAGRIDMVKLLLTYNAEVH